MSNGVITAAWIQGLLQGVPIAAASVIAFRALRGWKDEATGQRRIHNAERCLQASYAVSDAVDHLRRTAFISDSLHPGLSPTEDYNQRQFVLNELRAPLTSAFAATDILASSYRAAADLIPDLPEADGSGKAVPEQLRSLLQRLGGTISYAYNNPVPDAEWKNLEHPIWQARFKICSQFRGQMPNGNPFPEEDEFWSEIERLTNTLRSRLLRELRA